MNNITVNSQTLQLLSNVVGNLTPVNPQASFLGKIKNFVTSRFSSQGTSPQLAMRKEIINFTKAINAGKADQAQAAELVKSFAARVKSLDSSLENEQIVPLFLLTLKTLARAYRNPAPALTDKNIQLCEDWAKEALGIKPEAPKTESRFPFKKAALAATLVATVAATAYGATYLLEATKNESALSNPPFCYPSDFFCRQSQDLTNWGWTPWNITTAPVVNGTV